MARDEEVFTSALGVGKVTNREIDDTCRCRSLLIALMRSDTPARRRATWMEISRIASSAAASLAEKHGSPATGAMVTIPGDPVRVLSPNLRICWQERRRRVSEWRQRARLAWLEGEQLSFPVKVEVEFTIRRARRVDPDNALAAMKSIVDGLCTRDGERCLLRGDTEEDVCYKPVMQDIGNRWKNKEEVLVYVRPIPITDPSKKEFWS